MQLSPLKDCSREVTFGLPALNSTSNGNDISNVHSMNSTWHKMQTIEFTPRIIISQPQNVVFGSKVRSIFNKYNYCTIKTLNI